MTYILNCTAGGVCVAFVCWNLHRATDSAVPLPTAVWRAFTGVVITGGVWMILTALYVVACTDVK